MNCKKQEIGNNMITNFFEWLKNKNLIENDYYGSDIYNQSKNTGNNVSFAHPLSPHRNLDSQFPIGTTRPNMHELEKFINDSIKRGGDAVTSLHNLAAGALAGDRTPGNVKSNLDGSNMDDHESRGSRPSGWNFTLILQRLGFRDSTNFFEWFNDRGGRKIVADWEKRLKSL